MNPILIVDDNEQIVEILSRYIAAEGWPLLCARSGEEALSLFDAADPSVILLDILLPGIDGLEVCRRIRAMDNKIGIIMLTARDSVIDKVSGLDSGADDYITKPFAIEELLARIRAALRKRSSARAGAVLSAGPLEMDVDKHSVTVKGQGVELTKKEFDLLHHLLENKGRVLSREALLDSVWGFDFVGETNSVDVYIRFLRSKIDEAFGIKLIHTVRGVGYVIRED